MNRLFSLQVGTFYAGLGRYVLQHGTVWLALIGSRTWVLTL